MKPKKMSTKETNFAYISMPSKGMSAAIARMGTEGWTQIRCTLTVVCSSKKGHSTRWLPGTALFQKDGAMILLISRDVKIKRQLLTPCFKTIPAALRFIGTTRSTPEGSDFRVSDHIKETRDTVASLKKKK